MASYLYPSAKQAILNKEMDLDSDTIKATLTTTAYSSAHTVIGDITAVGNAVTLTTPTITNGVFNADNVTFSGLSSTSTVVGLVLWDDTTATDKLIAWIDFTDTDLTGVTSLTITWDTGSSKIFAL
jgi:hypothetical protein